MTCVWYTHFTDAEIRDAFGEWFVYNLSYFQALSNAVSQRAYTCTENVLKTRFQDVQNVNSEDVHKP